MSNSKKSVALQYDDDRDQAPRLVAKGTGIIADEIVRRAEDAAVPVYEDPALVNVLSELELDREIPPELYRGVSEVLAWVYKANASLESPEG